MYAISLSAQLGAIAHEFSNIKSQENCQRSYL